MDNMNDIVRLAVDAYHGKVEKYSVDQSQEVLRQALIEANGGSSIMDYRALRDGKCQGVFTLLEEILANTVNEGLTGTEFFFDFVDYRNVNEGDSPIFYIEDNNEFEVAEIADGTQAIRRQRLGGLSSFQIQTTTKAVRIYEELNRVLAGRVDFNTMISKVADAFQQYLLNDIYSLWVSVTADQFGGNTYFPTAGAYDEDALLDLIAHVEAAAGGLQATLVGTKKAIRKLKPSIESDGYKNDLYDMGFAGRFYGSPVVALPQRHKVGSTDFLLDDDIIYVIATADKPIKLVREGDPLIITREPAENYDLTIEYFYLEKWGTAIVTSGTNVGMGRYEMT